MQSDRFLWGCRYHIKRRVAGERGCPARGRDTLQGEQPVGSRRIGVELGHSSGSDRRLGERVGPGGCSGLAIPFDHGGASVG